MQAEGQRFESAKLHHSLFDYINTLTRFLSIALLSIGYLTSFKEGLSAPYEFAERFGDANIHFSQDKLIIVKKYRLAGSWR